MNDANNNEKVGDKNEVENLEGKDDGAKTLDDLQVVL